MRYIKILLITCITVVIIINLPLCKVLQIASAKNNHVVAHIPVSDQEEFVVTFIHSVNKRPVSDFFRAEGNQLVVFKSEYDAFGAGMPEMSIDGMELKMKENGMLELSNVNRKLDKVTIFVGTIAQHSLQIKGLNIPLANLASPGTPLEFKIAHTSYLQIWKGRKMHERL